MDAISRQDAISAIKEMSEWHTKDAFNADRVIRCLKELPSVLPKGHWIAIEDEEGNIVGHYCSKCDLPLETDDKTMYCPHCGCRMTEVWR